jgi:hypothetical protein
MAKAKSSNQKFMKHSGSIQGPADLSSRRGFSRVIDEKIVEEGQSVEEIRPQEAAASRVSTGKNLTAPSFNELHQAAQCDPGRAFGDPGFVVFHPCGTCDVEVNPGRLFGEFF